MVSLMCAEARAKSEEIEIELTRVFRERTTHVLMTSVGELGLQPFAFTVLLFVKRSQLPLSVFAPCRPAVSLPPVIRNSDRRQVLCIDAWDTQAIQVHARGGYQSCQGGRKRENSKRKRAKSIVRYAIPCKHVRNLDNQTQFSSD